MLALDLGLFQRRAHQPSIRETLAWSAVWIGLALLFNAGIYLWFGAQSALEFFTGYMVEKALSVDNLFVFLVVFSYFWVPPALQHRVLFWGILAVVYCELIKQESNWVISESVTRVGLSYPRGVLRCHRSSPRVLTNACCARVCWEST
jgi:hypothetical protein